MIVNTRLAPGDTGFVLHNNQVSQCKVRHVSINLRLERQSSIMPEVEVDIHYSLDLGSTSQRDNHIHNVEEARVFATKEDLLKSL